jgi:hypothetical protein
VLVAVVAVAAATREVNQLTRLPLEPATGGCYTGELPGFGKVQFNLFLDEPWGVAWLWRDGFEDTGYGLVNTNLAGGFHFDLLIGRDEATNATLDFNMADDGGALRGMIRNGSNSLDQLFVLKRTYEHWTVRRDSRLVFGRLGAYAKASSQFPLLPTNSPLCVALNRKLASESQKSVRRFTSGNFQRQWEMLRYGPPMTEGEQDDLWQVRLLGNKVASFAVWDWSDYGGSNGNLTSWRGRNFWWRDGKLCELTLSNLFRPGVDWKSQIRRLCCDDLQRQQYTSESTAVLDEDVGVEEFTISTTGIQIYFNPYTIASGGNGEYIIHIPYATLRQHLRADFLAAIGRSSSFQ